MSISEIINHQDVEPINQDYTPTIALTPELRSIAYHLRYRVYIGEQKKPYPEADHKRNWLTDRLDCDAAVIIVSRPDDACGTVRACFADCEYVKATYEKQFELNRFEEIADRSIAICSRLAVLRNYRATPTIRILLREIYRYGIGRDTQLTFQACAPALRPFFSRYGFREYCPPCFDPIVGPLHRMLLVLDDLVHLNKTNSPFLPTATELAVKHVARPWLDEIFEAHQKGATVTSELIRNRI